MNSLPWRLRTMPAWSRRGRAPGRQGIRTRTASPGTSTRSMAELRIRRAARADWATIWPVWHEIVAAGDTFAYDPDTSFDEGERMWFGPEPEETWVAESDDGVLLGDRKSTRLNSSHSQISYAVF